MSLEVTNPFELYFGQDGRPISAGSLYIGVAGLDPQIHPVDVFYDREMTVPAQQPLNISGGYVWNCCAPTKVFAAPADYSLKVLGKNGEQVFYCQNVEYLDEASRIGYLAPFTGSVIRTQGDKNADTVSLLDAINPSEYAAILAGTSTLDCTPALQKCLTTGKRVIVPTAGKYKFKTTLSHTGEFDVQATAPNVVFDFTDLTADSGIIVSGSIAQISDLNTDVLQGTQTLVFASAPSLVVGDWICIYNPTDSSFSGFRTYYRAGEWCQIIEVSGATVRIAKPLYSGYVAANVDVYKLTSPNKPRLANVKLLGDGSVQQLMQFSLCLDPLVDNVSFSHAANAAVFFDRCISPVYKNPNGRNVGDGGNDYGVLISNCQHARIYGGDIYSRRHAVATGGGNQVCSVPVRDFRCYDAILRNHPDQIIGAADFHGNVEDSSYERCQIYGGVNYGGADNYYINCKIHGDQASGRIGYAREVLGGTIGIIDCDAVVYGSPVSTGIIDFGGNSDSITANTTRDLTIKVKGLKIKGSGLASTASLILAANRGTIKKINFDIQDIQLDLNDLNDLLRTRLDSGTAASDFVIVDRIHGKMPANQIIFHTASAYASFPHRVMRQSGVISATTLANAVTSAPTQLLRFKYPRIPMCDLSVRGPLGGTSNFGGQAVMVHSISTSIGSIRPQIKANTAMTAGDAFEIVWSTFINEV